MAKNNGKDISMTTFAEFVAKAIKNDWSIRDLARELDMNEKSASVKLVELRKAYKAKGHVIPSLVRAERRKSDGTSSKKPIVSEAADLLFSLLNPVTETTETNPGTQLSTVVHETSTTEQLSEKVHHITETIEKFSEQMHEVEAELTSEKNELEAMLAG